MASTGPGSMFSICSLYSFTNDAMEWIHRASIPAKGPMPTHTQKMIAHTMASIERKMVDNVRMNTYTTRPIRDEYIRFLAAKKDSTKAKGIARTVARSAR